MEPMPLPPPKRYSRLAVASFGLLLLTFFFICSEGSAAEWGSGGWCQMSYQVFGGYASNYFPPSDIATA